MDLFLLHPTAHHFDYLPRLHLQGGEVSAAVDRDGLGEDGVQPLHLLPAEDANVAAFCVGHAAAPGAAAGGGAAVVL